MSLSKRFYLLLILLIGGLYACTPVRIILWNFVNHGDYKRFAKEEIKRNDSIQDEWPVALEVLSTKYKDKVRTLDEFFYWTRSNALIVIQDDTIRYEHYRKKYADGDYQTSFSLAKSFVGLLVGIAIEKGHIKSEYDLVSDYLEEFNREDLKDLKVIDLLQMQTNLNFDERTWNPFGKLSRLYYTRHTERFLKNLKRKERVDRQFDYSSLDTQILGLLLEKASGMTVGQCMQKWIWQKLPMESNAIWSLDSYKSEHTKAFCCFNAQARDYARIGQLLLHNGLYKENEIIPASWVKKVSNIDSTQHQTHFTYHWWHSRALSLVKNAQDSLRAKKLPPYKTAQYKKRKEKKAKLYFQTTYPDIYAKGYLGQFLYIYPKKKLIIVRLGRYCDKLSWRRWLLNFARNY